MRAVYVDSNVITSDHCECRSVQCFQIYSEILSHLTTQANFPFPVCFITYVWIIVVACVSIQMKKIYMA